VAETVPDPVDVFLGSNNSASQLDLQWSETQIMTSNSAISAFELYWDQGTGSDSLLLTRTSETGFLVSGLEPGLPYTFKVQAQNRYGFGNFSQDVRFVPADVPDQMSPVVT
jgi:hypothetical protein